MHITRLDVAHLRRITKAEISPSAGFNLLVGDNGAGKTSMLEAIYLLGYGRSFRGRVRDGVVQSETPAVEVYAEWTETSLMRDSRRNRRIGLRHSGQSWEGRLDGATEAQLGALCAALAVVCFEPGSHALVSGAGEPRRRFMDWGVFHVEPGFLELWRRYSRALKQRNRLLKLLRTSATEFEGWEREMSEAGEAITTLRERYVGELVRGVAHVSTELLPELGSTAMQFVPGWRRDEMPLRDALLLSRERDRAARFTTTGPHRADWIVQHEGRPYQEALSRGQAKLIALACVLAQAEHYAGVLGEWPIVLLDDVASELDRTHQAAALNYVLSAGAQVFATATQSLYPQLHARHDVTTFHVEQGRVTAAT